MTSSATGGGEPACCLLLCIGRGAAAGSHKAADRYTFSKVFEGSTSQREIYQHTTGQLVEDLVNLRLKSSVVMAYGTSGTGKTYSVEVRAILRMLTAWLVS
jgi:Cdc6-like AAA superfamily ATPase